MLNIFKNLTDDQIEQAADSLAKIHFRNYAEKEVHRQMRRNEAQYNFTYSEDDQKRIYQDVNRQQKSRIVNEFQSIRGLLRGLSEDNFKLLARYLSYPRGTTINSQAAYNRMMQARKVNELMRVIGKNNLTVLGVNLAEVKNYYVQSLSKSGGRYLKTPSIIITYNDMVTTGGHNISSKISRVSSTTNYKAPSSSSPTPSTKPSTPATPRPTTTAPSSGARPSSNSTPTQRPTTTTSTRPTTTTSRPTSVPGSGNTRTRSSVIPSSARTTRGF